MEEHNDDEDDDNGGDDARAVSMAPMSMTTKSEMEMVASMVIMPLLPPLPLPITSTRRRRMKDTKFDVDNLDVNDNNSTTIMG